MRNFFEVTMSLRNLANENSVKSSVVSCLDEEEPNTYIKSIQMFMFDIDSNLNSITPNAEKVEGYIKEIQSSMSLLNKCVVCDKQQEACQNFNENLAILQSCRILEITQEQRMHLKTSFDSLCKAFYY
jgi:hypothetical protein